MQLYVLVTKDKMYYARTPDVDIMGFTAIIEKAFKWSNKGCALYAKKSLSTLGFKTTLQPINKGGE
jgi:hypothetical protein